MLVVIDEHTRECRAIEVDRKLNSQRVLEILADLFVAHGPSEHIRSDNGPEFIATALRDWLCRLTVKTLFIEPGSPWENGYCESFHSRLRDEPLNGEIFCTPREARVMIEWWRRHYNRLRPHASLGYRPPEPQVILPTPSWQPYPAVVSADLLPDYIQAHTLALYSFQTCI